MKVTVWPTVGVVGVNVKLGVRGDPPETVRGSQGLVAPLLFASPEYTAFQLNEPPLANVWLAEFGTLPLVTTTGDPTTVPVPEQVDPVKKL